MSDFLVENFLIKYNLWVLFIILTPRTNVQEGPRSMTSISLAYLRSYLHPSKY